MLAGTSAWPCKRDKQSNTCVLGRGADNLDTCRAHKLNLWVDEGVHSVNAEQIGARHPQMHYRTPVSH
jgi:hypothetical protein